ncbi:maleylpyruvate isomerase N-terminal domain-containing protein [Streptomyces sp. NPDC056160]|uniref:maleylpyruvate isomerase N-terminal domain-containing protein n=1 Tax=Streptomyces sp. NPDC056160 TaxID=3345731 RepID=UPI0035DDF6A8
MRRRCHAGPRGPGGPRPVAASTDRFVATVAALTDAQAAGGTLVPPWTRGHVVTHVARAADSLSRLLSWARTGVETPQYASMDARAAEIEAGAGRPVADLVADVRDSAARFEAAVRALPPAAWHYEVRMRTGEPRTPATLISTRLRELEVHHADWMPNTASRTYRPTPPGGSSRTSPTHPPGDRTPRRCTWRRPTAASSVLWDRAAVPRSVDGRPTSSPGSAAAPPVRDSPRPLRTRFRRRPSGSDLDAPGAR